MANSTEPHTAYAHQRQTMVNRQIASRGIRSPLVLKAVGRVPREAFLRPPLHEFAYEDAPLPIAENQTISQPYIVAYMVDALQLSGGEQVLEIGTGSGYAAAVLGEIAAQVYTVERHKRLADNARDLLKTLNYQNVEVIHGDGSLGWPQGAPYQGIVVAAGGPDVPEPLKEQLAIGGRLVIPVGDSETNQTLICITRVSAQGYRQEQLTGVRFVPLIGEAAWQDSTDSQQTPRKTFSAKTLPWRGQEFALPAKPYTSELIVEAAEPIHDRLNEVSSKD